MPQIEAQGTGAHDASTDVFAAARWLGAQWNSTAKAISAEEIEWQCNTWGSGRGRADWLDTANFLVVAATFSLSTSVNRGARDELIVTVPLAKFRQIVNLLERLGDEPEAWPWYSWRSERDPLQQIGVAAATLAIPASKIEVNQPLREALQIG